MGTAHKTPAPKRRRKGRRAKPPNERPPNEKPPFELKTALAKRLWELRCRVRRDKTFRPLTSEQVEDLIDDMRVA